MDSYRFSSYDEAIDMLQKLKRGGKKSKVIIFSIDFDDEKGDAKKTVACPDYGCRLVRRSKTIIINEDEFIPHMQLFTESQNDLENIIRKGTMHDIIFGHRVI